MYTNILVPVLLDDNHDTAGAYGIAKELAAEDAQFHVVHVMEPIPQFAVTHIPDAVLSETREAVHTALLSSAEALPGATTAMVNGHPGTAIVDYAKEHEVDCIIIASHKPGLEDFFLGSTAARVVRHAKCPVHVIR